MTPLASLTPFVEVLPATAAGKPRAVKWYAGLLEHEYTTNHAFVFEDAGVGGEGYGVAEEPARGGRLFKVTKCDTGGEPYAVFCSATGNADACDCPAGTYRRAKAGACRHLLAVRAALANGWAGVAPRPTAPHALDPARVTAAFA
mgnify:CR=1 FL=1